MRLSVSTLLMRGFGIWMPGGKMFLTLAGAMSTAEMGISVAELIRQDKIHGICCTGANLEEDIFNLVAIPTMSVFRIIAR